MFQNGFIAGHEVVWKPRQGIIGFIFIARTHGGSLMRIPSANIVGVVDPNEERAETLASMVGAPVCESLEDCVTG